VLGLQEELQILDLPRHASSSKATSVTVFPLPIPSDSNSNSTKKKNRRRRFASLRLGENQGNQHTHLAFVEMGAHLVELSGQGYPPR
jgi:hypothetical protein